MSFPDYFSFDLFQTVLDNYATTTEKFKLIRFECQNACAEGENYTAELFRLKLHFSNSKTNKEQQLSVIVKCGNEEGGVKSSIAETLNIFAKEVEMFSCTFPALYSILAESYTLSSRCFYTSLSPHACIVLEDLTTLGFGNVPRHEGFDLEHSLKVIEKLAKMHAASVVMYENEPKLMRNYSAGLFADKPLIREWILSGYTALTDACSRWPGLEKFGHKLSALGNEAVERGIEAYQKRFGGFNVLNHGDLWTNNMMFSYESNKKLRDMRFIDFQMNIFTSPAIDLHYFIATSTKVEVKKKSIDVILEFYYANLLINLVNLKYSITKVPSLVQFREDFERRAFYGLMGAATVLTFVKAPPRKDASFENVIKDKSADGFRYHAYNNERYRQHIEVLLPFYDSLGILD